MPGVFFVRYEDLIENPANVMFKTAQFLDLSIDEATVKEVINLIDDKKATSNVGYYRGGKRYENDLIEAELDQINAVLRQEILGFGYPIK